MKKFSFKLQPLLNYRAHIEKEILDQFTKIYGEYLSIENSIETASEKRKQMLADSHLLLEQGNLNLFYLRDQARKGLKTKMGVQTQILRKKEIPLNEARKKLIEATKKKKILEILKDKAKNKYLQEYLTEEQNELDEIANTIYSKKQIKS